MTAPRFVAIAVFVLAILVTNSAQAQFAFCGGASQGVAFGLDSSDDAWEPGGSWEIAAGVCVDTGFVIVQVAPDLTYTRRSIGSVLVDHLDVGLNMTALLKMRPLLAGLHVGLSQRIGDDPRTAGLIDSNGNSLEHELALGIDVGPVLWWPVRRWLAFTVAVDYEATLVEELDGLTPGPPTHGIVGRMGLVTIFPL